MFSVLSKSDREAISLRPYKTDSPCKSARFAREKYFMDVIVRIDDLAHQAELERLAKAKRKLQEELDANTQKISVLQKKMKR